jgi:hypothetical protein
VNGFSLSRCVSLHEQLFARFDLAALASLTLQSTQES